MCIPCGGGRGRPTREGTGEEESRVGFLEMFSLGIQRVNGISVSARVCETRVLWFNLRRPAAKTKRLALGA